MVDRQLDINVTLSRPIPDINCEGDDCPVMKFLVINMATYPLSR